MLTEDTIKDTIRVDSNKFCRIADMKEHEGTELKELKSAHRAYTGPSLRSSGPETETGAGNPKMFRLSQRVSRSALSPTYNLQARTLAPPSCRAFICGDFTFRVYGRGKRRISTCLPEVKGRAKMTPAAVKLSAQTRLSRFVCVFSHLSPAAGVT